MPIRARTASASTRGSVMSSPSSVMRPSSTTSSRLTQRSSVDLPEPRRADQHDALAALDVEVDVAQDDVVAERLADAVELEQAHRGDLDSDARRAVHALLAREVVGEPGHRDGEAARTDAATTYGVKLKSSPSRSGRRGSRR